MLNLRAAPAYKSQVCRYMSKSPQKTLMRIGQKLETYNSIYRTDRS